MSVTEDQLHTPTVSASSRGESVKSLIWEVLQTVVLTILIFVAVRALVQNFRVEGASMEPTLHRDQYIVINKVAYSRLDGLPISPLIGAEAKPTSPPKYIFGGPQRGDIVVFKAPGSTDRDFIKRVMGLPGEEVRVSAGNVIVNGKKLEEPYIKYHASYDFQTRTVPERQYFVLGDNRPNSTDSHLGWFVPIEDVIGRAWVTYWPPDLWGAVSPPVYAR
ncbi:MAG: signal peptidase I [Chloroflexota bacterium]